MTAPIPVAAFQIDSAGRARRISELTTEPDTSGGYVWLHFDRSDRNLAGWLAGRLPDTPAMSLVQEETRPRADAHQGGLIINLRGVNLNPGSASEDMVSLRMWVTEALVITVRMRKLFTLDAMRQTAEAGTAPDSPAEFLAKLSGGLTERIEEVSMALEDEASDQEEIAFHEDHDSGMEGAPDLALSRRRVIRLRRFLAPQKEALLRLAASDLGFITESARSSLRECANLTARAVEELDAARDRLNVVQDHIDAKQAARIARNSYVLSIVAAIFLPLGFLTGLFGMNVAGLPGTQWAGAFTVVTLAMAGVGVGLFLLFRALRWF